MAAVEVLPRRFGREGVIAGPESFRGKDKAVGVGVGEGKAIVVAARAGAEGDFGCNAGRNTAAAKQLVGGAAVPFYEFGEAPGAEHPADHLKEADDVGLAGTVGANQDGTARQPGKRNVGQGAEAADADGLNCGRGRGSIPVGLGEIEGGFGGHKGHLRGTPGIANIGIVAKAASPLASAHFGIGLKGRPRWGKNAGNSNRAGETSQAGWTLAGNVSLCQ